MKVSREANLTRAFVLDVEDIELLNERLRERKLSIKFEVKSKDGLKRDFSTLEEFLKFENSPKQDIRELRIRGLSENLMFYLRFDKDPMKNIGINLEGDEEAVMAINETIDNRLAAMKPWYSLLASTWSWMALWILAGILCSSPAILRVIIGRETAQHAFGVYSSLSFWFLVIVLIPVYYLLEKARMAIFPIGVFALGQGKKRHKDKEIIRTAVVVGFFISLASSIIASLIFALRG